MKNVVVIGGNKGVGYEVVKECLAKGYRVALSCKEPESEFPIKEHESLIIRSFDLHNILKGRSFIDEVVSKWGRIDGVVFYAGVTPISSLIDCTEELYDEIFDINLKSTFFLTQKAIKSMLDNGGGSLVYFGTSHMDSGMIDRAAYAISKGGVKTLSEHISRRYARFKIRSNLIVMGWTPTEGEIALRASLGISTEELIAEASAYVPMGRMMRVDESIPVVMYFLDDSSSMVTGSIVRVNGGEYI